MMDTKLSDLNGELKVNGWWPEKYFDYDNITKNAFVLKGYTASEMIQKGVNVLHRQKDSLLYIRFGNKNHRPTLGHSSRIFFYYM